MPREVVFLDALLPTLLPLFCVCLGLHWFLDRLLRRLGLYRHVFHPALFRLALFVLLYSGLGLLVYR